MTAVNRWLQPGSGGRAWCPLAVVMGLDATERWGGLLSVVYSATWFAVSHPLIWGIHTVALREWVVLPVLAVMVGVWAIAYRRSKSLRWPIAGHMCANLFGMSVPVLLNIHVPYER